MTDIFRARGLDSSPMIPIELKIERRRGRLPVVVTIIKASTYQDTPSSDVSDVVTILFPISEDPECAHHMRYRAVRLDRAGLAGLDVVIISHPYDRVIICVRNRRPTVDACEY